MPYLQKFGRLEPKNPTAWIDLAKAQADLGQLGQARATFRKVLARLPQDPTVRIAWCRFLLETDRPNAADLDEALSSAQRAVELSPGASLPRETLAIALMANGREEEARRTVTPILDAARAAGNHDLATSLNDRLDGARAPQR